MPEEEQVAKQQVTEVMAMQLNVLEAADPCTAVAVAEVDMVGQLEQIQAVAPEGDA